MKPIEAVKYAVAAAIILGIVALLVTQLMGQPFIIFVETGSMEPTLVPNDGYLAIPAFIAGPPEEGDVILFMSQELGGGELTTHRVVRETSQGYITKGDANPFTDQDGGEPPVSTGQIRSVGLQFADELVVIPGLGATVGGITQAMQSVIAIPFGLIGMEAPGVSAVSMAVLVIGLLLFIYSTATGSLDKHARDRSTGSILRNGVVVIAILTLVVIVPVNFSMLLPSGTYQIEIVSAVEPTDDERIIKAGKPGDVTYFVRNDGHLPVMVFLAPASPGVETPAGYTYVPRRSQINKTVVMHAPNQTGSYLRFVQESRYLVVLPPSLIAMAHNVHPLLAIGAINVTVASVVILLSIGVVGTGRIRMRSRSRNVPFGLTVRRMLPPLPWVGESRGRTPPSPPTRSPAGEPETSLPVPRDSPNLDRKKIRSPANESVAGKTDSDKPTIDDSSSNIDPDADATVVKANEGGETDHGGSSFGPAESDLDGCQLIALYGTLQKPPSAVGYDAETWTVALLQAHIEETYGVVADQETYELLLDQARTDT